MVSEQSEVVSRVVIRVMGDCGREGPQPAIQMDGRKPTVSPIGHNNSNHYDIHTCSYIACSLLMHACFYSMLLVY